MHNLLLFFVHVLLDKDYSHLLTFFHSNYTSSDELDLHGLHVDEAITALQEKLTSCKGDTVCSIQHVFGTSVVGRFRIQQASSHL